MCVCMYVGGEEGQIHDDNGNKKNICIYIYMYVYTYKVKKVWMKEILNKSI